MDQIAVPEQTSHSQVPCGWAGLLLRSEHFVHKANPTSPSLHRRPVLCGAGLRGPEGRRALAEPGGGGGGAQEIPQWLVADPVRRLSQSPGSPRELLFLPVWDAQERPELDVLGCLAFPVLTPRVEHGPASPNAPFPLARGAGRVFSVFFPCLPSGTTAALATCPRCASGPTRTLTTSSRPS